MLTIYSKDDCPQCRTALAMVKTKKLAHQVKKLGVDYTKEELLQIIPSARTMPQMVWDYEGKTTVIGGMPEIQKFLSRYVDNPADLI